MFAHHPASPALFRAQFKQRNDVSVETLARGPSPVFEIGMNFVGQIFDGEIGHASAYKHTKLEILLTPFSAAKNVENRLAPHLDVRHRPE